MVSRKLNVYKYRGVVGAKNEPHFLALQVTSYNIHKIVESLELIVKDVKLEEDEIIIVKNRHNHVQRIHIGEYCVIDNWFHVFGMSHDVLKYLFEEVCNGGDE